MDSQGDLFSFIRSKEQDFILWNVDESYPFKWSLELLEKLLVQIFGDRDISDIMLADDDYVRLMAGDECYFLAVGLYDNDIDRPIVSRLPTTIFTEFLLSSECRARELTYAGEYDSSAIALNADNTEYKGTLDRLFFRTMSVPNSFANVGATTLTVLRPLRPVPRMSSLHVHPLTAELFRVKDKMVVCSGPTASGKSTTICSGIIELAEIYHRIFYSVENPIEYALQHVKGLRGTIKQFDLHRDFKGRYEIGINCFLRMHGRNIYASEVRESVEVQAVIQAQRSNQQVFTTTHADRAWDVPNRLVGEIPLEIRTSELIDLVYYLGGISAQKLVKLTTRSVLLQDVVIFTDADRASIIDYIRSTSASTSEAASATSFIKELIIEKVKRGEAVTQAEHLEYHLQQKFISYEEYEKIKLEMGSALQLL